MIQVFSCDGPYSMIQLDKSYNRNGLEKRDSIMCLRCVKIELVEIEVCERQCE